MNALRLAKARLLDSCSINLKCLDANKSLFFCLCCSNDSAPRDINIKFESQNKINEY